LTKSNEWKAVGVKSMIYGLYYDFKMLDGSIVIAGMFKNGKFGDKYGIPIARPKYFRDTVLEHLEA
jgi:hypothetical protein